MRQLALALSVFTAAGCFLALDPDELEIAPVPDADRADGSVDAGERDAGERDAGERDAGERDAGERDAGERDAGEVDAGTVPDAGEFCPPLMALVRGGTFTLAETDQTISVADFCIDSFEVTTGEYATFEDGSDNPPGVGGACNWSLDSQADHPINCVKWSQALAYCQSRQKRLPSEAEWEWAARGGEAGNCFPWGRTNPSAETPELCWSGDDGRAGTRAIGLFPGGQTDLGIFDLAGNAAEWTHSSGISYAAIRGGSWASNMAVQVQTGHRETQPRDYSSAEVGFRCAQETAR